MKNDKRKNREIHQLSDGWSEPACTEMDWFRQFDDRPGLEALYTPEELQAMKTEMFSRFKKKINKLD